ncbi:ExbD/TolR family protein [Duncaniella muris]|jgi:biopolymer transport protein ExbD|uniref:ExbD/TolR family protein n=1 Tax=Duncaniella muris TaxID=2094150 RepID=UPI00272E95B7|nr:biopolymer transporter ExbD [Duncaniella muris]
MAQIEQSDKGGKKKKGAQKKMSIHVDFTPMVDMNMLLITFFMLCTTMIKSQTLSIALPTNEKVEQQEMNKAKDSEAITLIVDTERNDDGSIKKDDEGKAKNIVYYYLGKPMVTDENNDSIFEDSNLMRETFIGNDEQGMQQGIRKILHNRNKAVLEKIAVLKQQWRNKEFSSKKDINDSIYQARAKEIRNDSTLTRPVVIIKATPNASWASVIGALDEMQINQISRYQIDNINATDQGMIDAYIRNHGN